MPSVFDGFEEPLKLDLGGPAALGLGADIVGYVGGNAVVVRLEGGFHLVEQPSSVLVFIIIVGEEDDGEVNLATLDVNRLESVDKGFIEPLEVVVVGRTNNGGEVLLGFREEIFCVFGVVIVLTARRHGYRG